MSNTENKLKVNTELEKKYRENEVKALAVGLVLLFGVVVGILDSSGVSAKQESGWTMATPVVTKNVPILQIPDTNCGSYHQSIMITEFGTPRDLCVYGDERLKIGTFYEGGVRAAVQFPFSTNMHVLDAICTVACQYSADNDMLVTRQQISQYGQGLVVYRHVSKRIQRVVVPANGPKYTFDVALPDYEMKNDAGRYVQTSAFSMSSNGRWIVTELYNKGIAVTDTSTMTTRHITTEGYMYGRGMDPSEELAISDDGKSVVVTGQNAGFRVIDVTTSCGQDLIGDLVPVSGAMSCNWGDLTIGALFPNFASASHPRFYGDGHQLEIVVNDWAMGLRRVTFVKSGTQVAHLLKLLSLGDSFSSGEGETDDAYYEIGTNQGFDTCHTSTRAYPGLIAVKLGIHTDTAKNVACSGAKIADIVGSTDAYWGQSDRLGGAGLRLSASEKRLSQEKAVDDFQPGRSLQSDFISRYNPEILTIGIGGNDAGLMGKLRTCAMPGTCEWAKGDTLGETAGEIGRLYGKLMSLFMTIEHDMGSTRVFIVGYPAIINPDGECDPLTGFLLDYAERVYVQRSIQYLNQVIHAAANSAGLTYLDIEQSFQGAGLCAGVQSSAMNGLRTGDDIAVVSTLPMLKVIGTETFHPTPTGHALMTNTILAAHPYLAEEGADTNGIGVDPAPYWAGDEPQSGTVTSIADFAHSETSDLQKMAIQLPEGSLQPGSTISIELHSEPHVLAIFAATTEGGVEGSIVIPSSLQAGFHTLHFLGTNVTGESIDLYQFLTVGQTGSVLSVGVGEGDGGVSATRLISDHTLPLAEHHDTVISDIVSVLGVQSTHDVKPSIQKAVETIGSIAKSISTGGWVIYGGLVVVVTTLISVLCIFFVRRRWVKPGS